MGQVTDLNTENAFSLICSAYEICREKGRAASMSVAGRNGNIIAQLVMDDVRPVTANIALMKSRQSAMTAEATGWLRDCVESGEYTLELFGLQKKDWVPWAGGVPVYSAEGILLGGFGVCNLPEEEDEEIAVLAVEKCGFRISRD